MAIIRKKYIPVISLFLSVIFFYFIVIADFPYLHNLDADFNIWDVKTAVILEGEHHHEDNPQSACFDYHKIKIIDIGYCFCQVIGNLRLILPNNSLNFNCNNSYPFNYFKYSSFIPSNNYNIPIYRAPPLS